MKRKASLVLAIVFALFCAAGCSTHTRRHDPTVIFDPDAIVIMGKKDDLEKPYMTKIFERYKSATGKNLNLLKTDDDSFEGEAQKRFEGGDAPDILLHFHNDDLNRLDVESNFMYFDDEEWVDDMTESALKYCSDATGHILGLPFWESSVSGCYYNKTLLLETLGFNVQKITEQTQFDRLCERIVGIKDSDITPICWPGNGCSWMYQFALDPIFADDPELLTRLNNEEKGYKDIPAVRKMVEWIDKANRSGWLGSKDDIFATDWDSISGKLNSGECAMIFIWDTWFYTDFQEGQYTKEDFALMPVFMNTVAGGTYEGGNINMMMVNKNSEKKDLALEFLRFCAEPENYNVAFEGIATVNCFKGQNTTIQSHMVTDTQTSASISKNERVSTASTKIAGYSATDVDAAFDELIRGNLNVDQCLARLDEDRLKEKHK